MHTECGYDIRNLVILLTKTTFLPFFLLFPPTMCKSRFYYYFFSSDVAKNSFWTSSTKQYTVDGLTGYGQDAD